MSKSHDRARKRGWTGDFDDECSLHRYGYMAHVEKMSKGVWWVAVYRENPKPPMEIQAFNSANMQEICSIPSGEAARAAAELLLECLRECKI